MHFWGEKTKQTRLYKIKDSHIKNKKERERQRDRDRKRETETLIYLLVAVVVILEDTKATMQALSSRSSASQHTIVLGLLLCCQVIGQSPRKVLGSYVTMSDNRERRVHGRREREALKHRQTRGRWGGVGGGGGKK